MSDAGKSIWITGASHGIGRNLAIQYAKKGNRVACSARTEEALRTLQLEQPACHLWPVDVTHEDTVAEVVQHIETDQGALDLAILNAGIYQPVPGGIAPVEVFRQHMEVNYMGIVNGLMTVLPGMRKRGQGQIAIVASVAGYRGLPMASAYGPSKAALINLAETLRLELRGSGIDIRLINPGFVDTRLTKKNDFEMPSLVTSDDAAKRIIRGLQGSSFETTFPFGFVSWLKLVRLLPYRLYFPLMARLTRK